MYSGQHNAHIINYKASECDITLLAVNEELRIERGWRRVDHKPLTKLPHSLRKSHSPVQFIIR